MKISILLVILLLSISYTVQGQTQGCLYESKYDGWTCDFKRWRPPLKDESFAIQPYRQLKVDKINGVIPAEVRFSVFFYHFVKCLVFLPFASVGIQYLSCSFFKATFL